MRYINFLGISICLLLNVAAYSSECWCIKGLGTKKNDPVKESNTETDVLDPADKASENSLKKIIDWRGIIRNLNPGLTPAQQLSAALMHKDTYKRNNDGIFTLGKATIIIDEFQKRFDLPDNLTFPHSSNPSHNPLAWICSKEAITKAELNEKERLKIGQYFLRVKGLADDGVIEQALAVCIRNSEDNSTIITTMQQKLAMNIIQRSIAQIYDPESSE